jgi:hypothetical protein
MEEAIVFLAGLCVGFVIGMVAQWVADLPREYRR